MILFTLRCAHGHEFEGWFRDGDGFEAQQKAGGIAGAKAVNDNFGLIAGGALMLSILGSGFGLLPGTRSRIVAQHIDAGTAISDSRER